MIIMIIYSKGTVTVLVMRSCITQPPLTRDLYLALLIMSPLSMPMGWMEWRRVTAFWYEAVPELPMDLRQHLHQFLLATWSSDTG